METDYFAEVDFEAITDLGLPEPQPTETDWTIPEDDEAILEAYFEEIENCQCC